MAEFSSIQHNKVELIPYKTRPMIDPFNTTSHNKSRRATDANIYNPCQIHQQ